VLDKGAHLSDMPSRRLIKDPERYKTALCRTWLATGSCPYHRKCQFAHGVEELRKRSALEKNESEPEPDLPLISHAFQEQVCVRSTSSTPPQQQMPPLPPGPPPAHAILRPFHACRASILQASSPQTSSAPVVPPCNTCGAAPVMPSVPSKSEELMQLSDSEDASPLHCNERTGKVETQLIPLLAKDVSYPTAMVRRAVSFVFDDADSCESPCDVEWSAHSGRWAPSPMTGIHCIGMNAAAGAA